MTMPMLLRGAAVLSFAIISGANVQWPAPHERGTAPASLPTGETVIPPMPWAQDDPGDELYRAARQALIDRQFARAAQLFAELMTKHPKSAYVGDSMYYRGYALYRLGGEANLRESLRMLELEKQRYPKASTIGDANELAVRVRGALAQRGDARSAEAVTSAASTRCERNDPQGDDIRAEAMNALLHMETESAIPIIKQVLQRRDACSAQLRKKAVFLLSQKNSGETVSLLIDASRNDPSADVRGDAVFWLGQVRSDAAAEALEEIALHSPRLELRDKAIFALGQQGSARGMSLLRRLAESSDTPRKMRKQAIWQLGQANQADNAAFLRALFPKLPRNDDDLRKQLMFSLAQMRRQGNDVWLLGLATDESQSEELRKHAIWTAGQAGASGSALVALYDRLTDRDMKQHMIWVLSESSDRVASDRLVAIARGDRDHELRKKAIFWLGQKHDPRIRQILLDILTNG